MGNTDVCVMDLMKQLYNAYGWQQQSILLVGNLLVLLPILIVPKMKGTLYMVSLSVCCLIMNRRADDHRWVVMMVYLT